MGLYSWAHNLLPIVSGKSSNPQSRDIILQLVEKYASFVFYFSFPPLFLCFSIFQNVNFVLCLQNFVFPEGSYNFSEWCC